jgi:hypothetical protein
MMAQASDMANPRWRRYAPLRFERGALALPQKPLLLKHDRRGSLRALQRVLDVRESLADLASVEDGSEKLAVEIVGLDEVGIHTRALSQPDIEEVMQGSRE